MKIVRVRYTVNEDYVAHNKANIAQVMDDLRALNNPDTKYASYLEEDGVTFMHFAQYPDEETAKLLNGLPAFEKFRRELKESKPLSPPVSNNMSLVASAYDIF